jgi:triphosphoribosyl-dephospho-CoA synthase
MLPIGGLATLACLLEATAPKPGNVHRGADFEDLGFVDFVVAATAIAPAMEAAATGRPVGRAVLDAVERTQASVGKNVNLGTVLLIAPLAAVPRERPLKEGVREVLASLDADDARHVYEAIRLARPGGMGRVEAMDFAGPPPGDLLAAMRAAAGRDLVARQYAENFTHVFECALPWLCEGADNGRSLTDRIVYAHVRLMNRFPDSLIARKCGHETAQRCAFMAGTVLEAGRPGDEAYLRALEDLDFWLRADGHRRNPGTTADLVAAGLFAGLRDGIIQPPLR